jgi:DNA invertase Pin-like site-specific DNA recombinase
MTPTHAVKNGRRYRYYVSRPLIVGARADADAGLRVPAAEIEQIVTNRIRRLLSEPANIFQIIEDQGGGLLMHQKLMTRAADLAGEWAGMSPLRLRVILLALVERVDMRLDEVTIHLRPRRLAALLDDRLTATNPGTIDDEPTLRRTLRCAVYTRKSSEEGLEQEFNSLHAQREACEAFIRSQRHEGWSCLPQAYDDGGRSGGNLERPALQQLLAEIREGKVDVVVVYKIDRLTRSLADFAKIVEIFDAKGVSFVSVTQQFNTTTSMGRLTLNVLLSFAQFGLVVRAHRFHDLLVKHKGGKFGDLAKSEKLHRSYFRQLLRLAYLAPDITTALLDGHQPAGLTATQLIERADLPMSWREQRRTLGFA